MRAKNKSIKLKAFINNDNENQGCYTGKVVSISLKQPDILEIFMFSTNSITVC